MLEEIKKTYLKEAQRIKGWENLSVNILANLYIDNENDELLKSAYFSTIILKKWGYIAKHYAASKASGFSIEDCYDMVVHGIQYALKNRKWRDPNNVLFNDKCAPDKVLNRCIASSRDIQYYNSNRDNRRANYGLTSLDLIQENVKDCTTVIADESDDYDNMVNDISIDLLLSSLIKKNKVFEVILIKTVLAGDCFRCKERTEKILDEEGQEEKVKKYSYEFKASKLVTAMQKLTALDIDNILASYNIKPEQKKKVMELLKTSKKSKLDKAIRLSILGMSQDSEVKDYLCF